MFKFFRVIGAIKRIRNIEPDKAWLEKQRLHFARLAGPQRTLAASFGFSKLRLATVLVAVALVASAGVGTVNQAQAALPMSFLYPVKLLSEQIQEIFVLGNEKKMDFALKLAERRFEEVEVIAAAERGVEGQANEAAVVAAILRAGENIEKTEKILNKISQSKSSGKVFKDLEKALDKLDNLAEHRAKILEKIGDRLPDAFAALESVNLASINVEQEANKIVITIATNFSTSTATSTAQATSSALSVAELLKNAAQKAIQRAEGKIAEVEARLATSTATSTAEFVVKTTKKLAEAKGKLGEARAAFQGNDFKKAIGRANEAYKKAIEAQVVLLKESVKKGGDKKDKDDDEEEDDDINPGIKQVIKLLTEGAGKSGKVSPGLLKAPGIEKKLEGHFDFDDEDEDNEDRDDEDEDEDDEDHSDMLTPVIANIGISNIGTSSAKIAWTTNEAADSRVNFGTSTSYGGNFASSSLVLSHAVVLEGLTSSTTYHFQIASKDAAGNTATSSDGTFITLSLPDTTQPAISSVGASGVTSSSVIVSWGTNELASGKLYYSASTPVDLASTSTLVQFDAVFALSHSFNLLNLNSTSTYYFLVEAKDAAGNTATSSEHSFATSE